MGRPITPIPINPICIEKYPFSLHFDEGCPTFDNCACHWGCQYFMYMNSMTASCGAVYIRRLKLFERIKVSMEYGFCPVCVALYISLYLCRPLPEQNKTIIL